MKHQYKFRKYLVSRTVLIASIPFGLIFFGAVTFSFASFSKAEIERQMLLTETLASETNIHFAAATDVMETAAYYMQSASLYPDTDPNGLFGYLAAVARKNPVISSIWVADAESGLITFNLPAVPSIKGTDISNSEIFVISKLKNASGLRDVHWSGVRYNEFYSSNYISASILMGDYILIGWFNPTSLIGIIADQKWQQHQFGFVCDRQGRVISHPRNDFIRDRKSLIEIPAVKKAAEGMSGYSFSQLKGADSQNYLYTVVREKNTGWLVGVAHAQNQLYSFVSWLIIGGIASIIISSAIIMLGARTASQHAAAALSELIKGTEAIAKGSYDTVLAEQEFVEFAAVSDSVKSMQRAVQDRENKLQELNASLETTVKARTRELEQSNTELMNALEELSATQDKMIKTEKLTALGQLAAGIAHELNTPLGATISAESVLEQFFKQDMEHCLLYISNAEPRTLQLFLSLYKTGIEKSSATSTIIERAKRKALQNTLQDMGIEGHYRITDYLINSGILDLPETNPEFFDRKDHEEILKVLNTIIIPLRMTSIIAEAAQKSVRVVQALQNYLRQDSEEAFLSIRVEEGIESVLTLLHNKLKHGVNIEREYAGVSIYAVAHQISQVWMNLLSNAAYAMDYKGTIRIATAKKDSKAVITVQNDGPAISEEIIEKIFEPFFTTKRNEGMGLGLDICKRIVEKHRGSIRVESVPGNTVFTVEFPIANENAP